MDACNVTVLAKKCIRGNRTGTVPASRCRHTLSGLPRLPRVSRNEKMSKKLHFCGEIRKNMAFLRRICSDVTRPHSFRFVPRRRTSNVGNDFFRIRKQSSSLRVQRFGDSGFITPTHYGPHVFGRTNRARD